MQSDRQLSLNPAKQWFALDDLISSVLADTIETDAQFQLMQGEAWLKFGQDLRQLHTLPHTETLDFTAGFGRLENLGLSELNLEMSLQCYRPNWLKRAFWLIAALFGKKPTPTPALYRLTKTRRDRNHQLKVTLKISRDQYGHWQTSTEPDPSLSNVA